MRGATFDVKRGETVGVIGLNGGGKSTLLQLVCGILTPTEGTVQTIGRVGALLELGSGFNPEFTGNENIWMYASILGLTDDEIRDRYHKIIDFADIGNFIEQPVKTYSSGMMVRLAFAVIANIDADILVIDEALAVGDAVFTQKCMRFIRQFQEKGTLIFVSHDLGSVVNLCDKCIWIDHGEIKASGKSKDITERYLQFSLQQTYGNQFVLQSDASDESTQNNCEFIEDLTNGNDSEERFEFINNLSAASGWKTGGAEITAIDFEKVSGDGTTVFKGGEKVKVVIKAKAFSDMDRPILGFIVKDRLGQDLFGENTLGFSSVNTLHINSGEEFMAEFIFNLPMLPNGDYVVMTSVANGDYVNNVQHNYLHDAIFFKVYSSKVRYGLVGLSFDDVGLKKI